MRFVQPGAWMHAQTQPEPGWSVLPNKVMQLLPDNNCHVQEVSFVSRRRLDDETFDAEAVDEEGLPLVRLSMTFLLLLCV